MSLLIDSWRHLLYPLGYLASLLFGLRFFWQWLQSEKAGKTLVDALFWRLSLIGNAMMATHYFIQVHFVLFLFQCINGFLAKRNLMLLKGAKPLSIQARFLAIFLILLIAAGLFLLQSWLCIGFIDWVRNPHAHKHTQELPLAWHMVGFLGICIFSVRFWLQWWQAETQAKSQLGPWFWWLSLTGALILCLYARMMSDPVTLISNALPLIGYIRNLVLMKKNASTVLPSIQDQEK